LDALNALGADKPDLKNNPNFQKIFQLFTDANNQGAVQERAIDTWILNELDFEGSGNSWNRLSSYARERNAEIDLLKKRLFEIESANLKTEYSGIDTERTIASLRSENESLVREVDRLKSTASIASNSANREKELELKLRTANARIQELESQLRTSELKLKELKDTKSSAASSAIDPNTNLISSQYSSASSTEQPAGRKTYDTPSYGVNSSYSESSVTSSEVKPSYVQQTTSNIYGSTYGTAGTSGYQPASKLTSSGRDTSTTYAPSTGSPATGIAPSSTYGTSGSSYGTSGLTSGTTGSTFGTTGVTGTTGTTGTGFGTSGSSFSSSGVRSGLTSGSNYGTTGLTSGSSTGNLTGGATYGTTGLTSSGYGATSGSSTGGATYGATGSSGSGYTAGSTGTATYGSSGATYGSSGVSSGFSSSTYGSGATGATGTFGTQGATGTGSSSSLASSGLRTAGSGLSSGYQFQTKRI
jgi:hypothetical protein